MSEQPASLLEVLAPILESAPEEELPLLLAWLERMAAEKYRVWAQQSADDVERKGLMDCAFREDAIAEVGYSALQKYGGSLRPNWDG